jgi:uncharacterized membrane protein YesL
MGNIFSYDNPVMQILMKIGDLIILNFIFLICCLPVFTIGAAQAGLFTAMKVMQDPEDDSSLYEAYFRGFKNGFLTVTLAWGGLMLGMIAVSFLAVGAYYYGLPGWLCLAPVLIFAWYVPQIPAFHSRFGCTAKQLIRNIWFLIIAHPLRTLGHAILYWIPIGLILGNLYYFFSAMPIWVTLYFSSAAAFGYSFLKKPFNVLIKHFEKTHAEETEPAEAEETAELPAAQEAETEEV